MEFVMQWFGYLLAFVLGSALTWGVLVLTVQPSQRENGDDS